MGTSQIGAEHSDEVKCDLLDELSVDPTEDKPLNMEISHLLVRFSSTAHQQVRVTKYQRGKEEVSGVGLYESASIGLSRRCGELLRVCQTAHQQAQATKKAEAQSGSFREHVGAPTLMLRNSGAAPFQEAECDLLIEI